MSNETTTPRLVRDGKVAVIYSPGFGAGWSTWNHEHEEMMMFHKDIALLVESGVTGAAKVLAESLAPGDLYLGADTLELHWVAVGSQFKINEYDGSESVEEYGEWSGVTA